MRNPEEFLAHHGIRGMKWGVRRADKKFEKLSNHPIVKRALLDGAEHKANQELLALDKKYKNDIQMLGGIPVGSKKYYDEVYSVLNKHLAEISSTQVNASGTRRLKASLDVDDRGVEHLNVSTEAIEHSANKVELPFERNANGAIVNVKFPDELLTLLDEPLAQSVTKTEDFLEHHGIRGMKWGVRRRRSASSGSSSRANKKATGSPRPSDEGRAARKILDKQKQHGTVALTNHELRTVNARVKLEQEFNKHTPPAKTKLKKGEDYANTFIKAVDTGVKVYTSTQRIKKVLVGVGVMTAKPTAAELAAAAAKAATP